VNVSLFQAAAALNANSRWQEVISENLASAAVPGYKKQEVAFEAIQSGVMKLRDNQATFGLPHPIVATNFTPGEMKYTGGKTDVAIDGNGFFQIQLPNGTAGYTRDGEFHLNSQGQLVTKDGNPVETDGGNATFDMHNPSAISISSTGVISQGATRKGQIKLVDFSNRNLLTSVGNGTFVANDSQLQPTDVAKPSVRQGFLEGANTSSVTEMANLITVMRTFEANQKTIQLNDERMGRVISEIGTPT
jgi:flagellar basal body rod protein FlgG